MYPFVAFGAERDQILFLVATRMAPELQVVHLEFVHLAASLASPAIALQHPSMQVALARRVKSQSGILPQASFFMKLSTAAGTYSEVYS